MPVLAGKRILAALLVVDTRLSAIETTLRKIMTEQSQVDADVQAVEGDVAQIGTAVTAIQAEIASLQSANPGVDLTGLNQAVTDLANATSSVEALEPAAPASSAAPTDTPPTA